MIYFIYFINLIFAYVFLFLRVYIHIITVITQKYFVKLFLFYIEVQTLHLDIVTTGVRLLRNYLIFLKICADALMVLYCYISYTYIYI